nr:EOG090X07W1 [Eulimnadia texana]
MLRLLQTVPHIPEENLKLTKGRHWFEDLENEDFDQLRLSLRKCLPKNCMKNKAVYELEVIDLLHDVVTYIPMLKDGEYLEAKSIMPCIPYSISLKDPEKVEISIHSDLDHDNWLNDSLLPKLEKWMKEAETEKNEITPQTLQLISLEEYNTLYCQLKDKYSKSIIEIWPECTDPQKFVHEDIAIAAYLLIVWKNERLEKKMDEKYKQSFVDIGCGNGLLVYVLASEGHPGKGLDIRKRKLWDLYPPYVNLEVSTVTGSMETTFPDFDWLLGNHSDELTPWIPVMALQSSILRVQLGQLPTRFWLLPCCPFSFYEKFQREKSKFSDARSSRYAQFLRFVQHVGETCGYQMNEDRMRIPSTRRICFLGSSLTENLESLKKLELQVLELIADSGKEFKPRAAVEEVRNCTTVDSSIKERVVNLTAKYLLSEPFEGSWNPGTVLELSVIVKKIIDDVKDAEFMRVLKSQFGGFQTLLKNHSHIFLVQGGKVRFRSPAEMSVNEWRDSLRPKKKRRGNDNEEKSVNVKKTKCWFFQNHPNGCPVSSDDCRYLHDSS